MLLWTAGLALAAVVAAVLTAGYGSSKPAPQPIKFSHKVHVADQRIACGYCHVYAAKSPAAGIPSVQRCMGCHLVAAKEKAEVQKLRGFWERKEPIAWIKVHNLPDYVVFSHKRHVRAGVGCRTCHGPVETMEQVRRVAPLKMGWCVNCHRARKADVGCIACHK